MGISKQELPPQEQEGMTQTEYRALKEEIAFQYGADNPELNSLMMERNRCYKAEARVAAAYRAGVEDMEKGILQNSAVMAMTAVLSEEVNRESWRKGLLAAGMLVDLTKRSLLSPK